MNDVMYIPKLSHLTEKHSLTHFSKIAAQKKKKNEIFSKFSEPS